MHNQRSGIIIIQMQQIIQDGVYICLKGVHAFHKLAKASCANLNTTY